MAEISDIAPLARFTKLTILDLEGTQVADINPLAGFTTLNLLNLRNNNIADSAPLEILPNLEGLLVKTGQFPRGKLDALNRALPNHVITER